MLKQGLKTTLNLFEHEHCPTFFRLVQTLCNLILGASVFDISVKK